MFTTATIVSILSLLFWSIYQKWDEKRLEYIERPWRTFSYFLLSGAIIVFVYPDVLNLFKPNIINLAFFFFVIWITFYLYEITHFLFNGPKKSLSEHKYWILLDKRYVWPKLAEITFQQIFLGSIFIIFVNQYSYSLKTFLFAILFFVIAHIPLFILQGKKIGLYYFLWAILGAPIFAITLIISGSLWNTISIHMLFYTLLSIFSWMFTGTRFDD